MTAPAIVVDEATLRRVVAEALAPVLAELDAIRVAQQPPTSPLINPAEFAKLLGVNQRTLHRMELAGEIPPAVRIGAKTVRWHRALVDEFLRTGRVDSRPPRLSMRRQKRSLDA